MGKRRPTKKTSRSTGSKPSRQDRRRAARSDAKAQQTVDTAAVPSYVRPDALALLALGLLVGVSYLPAMLWGGFVWDDHSCVTVEPVRKVSGLWQIWFSPSVIEGEGHYWPLVYTTFWLEHKLWGFNPAGYHIVNVLLHGANTLLVWHLLRRLAVPGAWVVAAVFAVHPLNVESVAWIIERKDVLSGLFYLAAVLAWTRFVEQPRPQRYAWALALYAAGLLSKSIAITLPAALLLGHWWKQGRVTSTDLVRLVPFCAVGLAITVGDLSFYRAADAKVLGDLDYSLTERTLIAARALWFYASKLLWPSNLAVIYPLWNIHVADPLAWGYLIAAIALAVALWHFRRVLGRGPLAGALFFAVTLSPVLGFVNYGYMQYAFVADRFQYLAGIGVMAVVIGATTAGVRHLPSWGQKGALGVAGVVLVALGLLTWRQASIYRDDETFYRHIIALNPQARGAHLNLGSALYKQARHEEALDIARIAVEQDPDYALAQANLGAILNALGRTEEAETHLRHAIALNPQARRAYLNLSKALYKQARYEEALGAARVAVEQDPDHAKAHLNLSAVLYKQGRYAEALDAARVAVEQDPDYAKAQANLGAILNALGRAEEAETHLRRAIALDPQDVDLFAQVLMRQGRYQEAIDALAQAAALAPASPQAAELHFIMGQAAQQNGQPEAAAEYYMCAFELDPRHAKALGWLGRLRNEQQRYDEALELFQRLIDIDPSDAAALGNMGIALFYLNRSDEALQRFDQALALDPTLKNVRANREAVLKAMAGATQ